jgi:hypothetical protein
MWLGPGRRDQIEHVVAVVSPISNDIGSADFLSGVTAAMISRVDLEQARLAAWAGSPRIVIRIRMEAWRRERT